MRSIMLVVGIAGVVGCGGVSKEQYQTKEAEAAKYQRASQEQSDKASALESKVTSLEQQNKALQEQNATLQASAAGLEQKVNETGAAHAELQGKTPLRIEEQLLFKENSSKLTEESKRALDSVAQALTKSTNKFVIISGYTDETEAGGKGGTSARGWQLSSARALEAAKYLAGRGLDRSRMAVAGFGQARPVAPNDSLANRSMNRRVEVILTPLNPNVATIDVKPAELKPRG